MITNKERNRRNESYKYRRSIILTREEGKAIETLVLEMNCKNLSQLCKRIARGEFSVSVRKGNIVDE